MNENDKNYVEPDISVVCNKDKITDKGCNGAPDWIIEKVDMFYQELAEPVRHFKETEGGRSQVCKAMEDFRHGIVNSNIHTMIKYG